MLSAAQSLKAEGVDVAVGVVETHGRSETAALLDGLDVLARKTVPYRNRTLMEFDFEAAITRRPKLLLVDEFAHSNAPGSLHPKRYQDVEDVLRAGIDVWTTMNIQHLESLTDVVQRIAGITVREIVPDKVLEAANEIVVIDLPPDELVKRLKEGKVYLPENARRAIDQFFKVSNLTALRELTLRRTADRVDGQDDRAIAAAGHRGPMADSGTVARVHWRRRACGCGRTHVQPGWRRRSNPNGSPSTFGKRNVRSRIGGSRCGSTRHWAWPNDWGRARRA